MLEPKLLHDQVPTMLQNISLRLARSAEHPEGSPAHGYDIVAPLDPAGHLDAEGWHKARDRCRVRRIWNGEPVRHGRLVHRAGGADGAKRLALESASSPKRNSPDELSAWWRPV